MILFGTTDYISKYRVPVNMRILDSDIKKASAEVNLEYAMPNEQSLFKLKERSWDELA